MFPLPIVSEAVWKQMSPFRNEKNTYYEPTQLLSEQSGIWFELFSWPKVIPGQMDAQFMQIICQKSSEAWMQEQSWEMGLKSTLVVLVVVVVVLVMLLPHRGAFHRRAQGVKGQNPVSQHLAPQTAGEGLIPGPHSVLPCESPISNPPLGVSAVMWTFDCCCCCCCRDS